MPFNKMSEIVNDPCIIRYGYHDTYNTYYTCVPADKDKYVCLKGMIVCFSLKHNQSTWKEVSVPRFLPKVLHARYLEFTNGMIVSHHDE